MSDNPFIPDDDETPSGLEAGSIVDGQYEIVRSLSSGFERGVYLCRRVDDPESNVALRILHLDRMGKDKETTVARFKREVLLTHSISHPNVVEVYEFIQNEEFLAYSMEYVEGGSLRNLLDSGQPIPIDRIIDILLQICAGMQEIHRLGITHRELKPENVLLTSDGQVKISDFGIAHAPSQRVLTLQGALLGTMEYMSPEYISQGIISKQLDIYSFGIVAYEMLTGTTPFQSPDVFQTISKRMSEEPERPEKYNSECPGVLGDIVLKALHREPQSRYRDAEEIIVSLGKVRTGEDSTATEALDRLLFDEAEAQRSPMDRPSDLFAQDKDSSVPGATIRTERYRPSQRLERSSLSSKKDATSVIQEMYEVDTQYSPGFNPIIEKILLYLALVIGSVLLIYVLYMYYE